MGLTDVVAAMDKTAAKKYLSKSQAAVKKSQKVVKDTTKAISKVKGMKPVGKAKYSLLKKLKSPAARKALLKKLKNPKVAAGAAAAGALGAYSIQKIKKKMKKTASDDEMEGRFVAMGFMEELGKIESEIDETQDEA